MPAQSPVLSRPEQMLYGRLVRAFPGRIILARVGLSRLLMVDDATPAADANRFGQLLADFVICAPDFAALAVFELVHSEPIGDRLHRSADAGALRLKDRLLNAAGIEVIRVRAEDLPSEAALKGLVATRPQRRSLERSVRRVS